MLYLLTFFGRGSAFNNPQNSAFFVDGTDLILVDCPMSSFHKLKAIGPDGISHKRIEKIYCLVTHTHGDHIGGIPMLIHFCYYVWHIPVFVGAPSDKVKDELHFYLEAMEGCHPDGYTLTTADTFSKWVQAVIPTTHSPELAGKCFGYFLTNGDKTAVYTGDTNTIEPFKPFIEKADILYTEVSVNDTPVHLFIDRVKEYLDEISKKGVEVYLMHLDNETIIKEKTAGTKLLFAPLYIGGKENMANNQEKMLSDIFAVSEKLYKDMNGTSGGDHNKVFEHLTTLGKILAESDRASFWKWDKMNHTLWTTAATGTDRITIPETTGLVGKALMEGKVVITNDPYNDPNFNSAVDKKTGYVTKSILVMPVANIKGEYIGAYQVINKLGGDGKFYEEEDCRKLSLAAMICGLALESDVFLEESYTDKLTSLKNRMGFFADFKRRYDSVIADPNRNLSLYICDIDKFKSVNDTYGHNAGDEVLKQVASIMAAHTRECDGIYRWGGEEFIMIMVDADLKFGADKAEEVRKAVEAVDCETEGYVIHHTMSFGVTEFDPAKTIEENISVADEKLYQAKESGRNRVIA